MELFRFDGDPCKWPDFIENFKNRVHDKRSFTDDIRMERLLMRTGWRSQTASKFDW